MGDDDIHHLLAQTAESLVMPRFRRLQAGEIEEKSPGEVVTVVDREVEQRLALELPKLLAGSRVVGEEACAAQPGLLQGLDRGDVWLVDPLDGTANFIAGGHDFALMVALLREGETIGAWMLQPVGGVLWHAQRGGGAWRGRERIRAASAGPLVRGIVKTRFLPEPLKTKVLANATALQQVQPGANCTAVDYPALAAGLSDFALYWRTLPWDHAPGVLWLQEAGGHAARLDGTPYRAAQRGEGLLAARDHDAWVASRRVLAL